jgi:hypothetical protein
MSFVAKQTDLRVARFVALVALCAGLSVFAVWWQGLREDHVPTVSHDQLGSARVFAAADYLRHLQVMVDEPAARGDSAQRGLLKYSRLVGRSVAGLPSTSAAQSVVARLPGCDVLSVTLDPRDWTGENGIYTNYTKRGRSAQRGACVSLLSDGELIAETNAGVCIHGGSSRGQVEKSLRLLLNAEFGSVGSASDLLPGALGASLVVHNDVRDMPFCNPMAYEVLGRIGCDVPLFRPVRLVVNGELLKRVYFLTEHLSESYVEEKIGHRQFIRHDERGGRSRVYARLVWEIARGDDGMASYESRVDCDGVIAWLTGVLFCGSIDNRQGVAYVDLNEMCWRWVAWDLDWSFRPWPKRFGGRVITRTSVTQHMRKHLGDLRSTMFDRLMARDGEFRARMLRQVSRALNHHWRPSWLRALVGRYRALADTYLARGRHGEYLDVIEEFVLERPDAMRLELIKEFGVGPTYACEIEAPDGAAFIVDGHRYDQAAVFHYFAGQEIEIQAVDGCALRVGGAPVAAGARRFVVDEDMQFAVVRR